MVARTGGALSRTGDEPAEPQDLAAWVREHGVTVAALSMMAVQLLLMATLLGQCYFRQDDFWNFDRALAGGFSWHYLMGVNVGHMAPLGFAMSWAVAHIALYSWLLGSVVILALVAGACLALLRLLRTLFGNRPGILIPLAVYLFCPLALAAVSWWSVAVQTLPLEISIFMATDAHVRYLRGGGRRRAVAAAGWLLLGLATVQRGALIPLLLFALTSAFFVEGRWAAAAVLTVRRYWRVWLLYAAMDAAYCVLFFTGLRGSATQPTMPGTAGRVLSFIGTLTGSTLVPGALGGPWRWSSLSDGSAQAAPVAALQQLAWGVALLIVVASCLYRVRAGRAWAILLGWIAVSDLVPPILGRLSGADPTLLGLQARYVTDAVSVLAVCLGLAFLPVAGSPDSYRFRLSAGTPGLHAVSVAARAGCLALAAAFLVGSFWSLQSLEGASHPHVARSYIGTAGVAVRQAPPGTVIIDSLTPSFIMAPIFFGDAAATSRVIGVLASPDRHLRWVRSPRGIAPGVMQFDQYGRLQPVHLAGLPSSPPPKGHCWNVTSAGTTIPLPRTLFRWTWSVRLNYNYSGPPATVVVRFGNSQARVALPAGIHSFYVPLTGSGKDVSVTLLSAATPPCVTGVTVGVWQPVKSGQAIPALPVVG